MLIRLYVLDRGYAGCCIRTSENTCSKHLVNKGKKKEGRGSLENLENPGPSRCGARNLPSPR